MLVGSAARTTSRRFGEWCNGSTADSGSACLGSNPSSPAFSNPSQERSCEGYFVSIYVDSPKAPTFSNIFEKHGCHRVDGQPAIKKLTWPGRRRVGEMLGSQTGLLPPHVRQLLEPRHAANLLGGAQHPIDG